MAKPAYQSRNSKFVVQQMPGGRKVLKDDAAEALKTPKEETQGDSLFD